MLAAFPFHLTQFLGRPFGLLRFCAPLAVSTLSSRRGRLAVGPLVNVCRSRKMNYARGPWMLQACNIQNVTDVCHFARLLQIGKKRGSQLAAIIGV
jgi:hypothetical protein